MEEDICRADGERVSTFSIDGMVKSRSLYSWDIVDNIVTLNIVQKLNCARKRRGK